MIKLQHKTRQVMSKLQKYQIRMYNAKSDIQIKGFQSCIAHENIRPKLKRSERKKVPNKPYYNDDDFT